uniref:PEP-CTERM sorting domain-containing protein n=1 Tax=Eiseniibacteriota bacterium TaxID=2212470 RepID=A0A832MJS9_UNCEI
MRLATTLLAGVLLAAAAAQAGAQTVDGTLDGSYGLPLSTQTTQTQFGNSSLGAIDYANGSELDVAHAVINGSTLYVFLGGNLESNFNKVEIFIDAIAGGQNKLRGDNPNVDFNGLNRMGDDGSGNGLTFDAGFEADYWFAVTGGGGPYQLYANYSELLTGGGGTGYYLGAANAGAGTLSGGTNPFGVEATINNSNTLGVDGGCDASSGAGVATGIELAIPLAAIGNPTGCIRISAFVNGSGHDFLANQVLGPLPPGTCNLGEPRIVNFEQIPGAQYFTVCAAVPAEKTSWGKLKTIYR